MSETNRIDSIQQHDPLAESLRPQLAAWLAALAARPAGGLASYTAPVDRAIDPGCPVPACGYAWSRPSRHHDLAGACVAAHATAAGEQRLEKGSEAHGGWLANWSLERAAAGPDPRVAVAGVWVEPQ